MSRRAANPVASPQRAPGVDDGTHVGDKSVVGRAAPAHQPGYPRIPVSPEPIIPYLATLQQDNLRVRGLCKLPQPSSGFTDGETQVKPEDGHAIYNATEAERNICITSAPRNHVPHWRVACKHAVLGPTHTSRNNGGATKAKVHLEPLVLFATHKQSTLSAHNVGALLLVSWSQDAPLRALQ